MTTNEYLTKVKDLLSEISTIKTLKIGLERGIGSKDAPFARILPISKQNKNHIPKLLFQVIIGFDIKNKNLEKLHEEFFNLEETIIKKLSNITIWHSTITDEDTVPNFKVAVINFESLIDVGVDCVY